MIAIDLSKQQALDADPRAIQLINITANIDRAGNTTMFFIIEEAKENFLDISQGTVKGIIKLSNSQLDKLKSAIKNETEVVLRLSSNMIVNSDDKTNFPHELLLTNRQVANLRKIIQQLILSHQKLNYLGWFNQEDFLVNFLAH